MKSFFLPPSAEPVDFELREIRGRPARVRTTGRMARLGEGLRLEVHAEDSDMLDLLATRSDPGADAFLYEEDCLQVATASPGSATPADFLLINAQGSRKGTAAAEAWRAEVRRGDFGWTITLFLPIPPGVPCLGLSLHRFFRGIHGEVQALVETIPHPLDLSQFTPVVLVAGPEGKALPETYRRSAEQAREEALRDQLAACRARMSRARGTGGPRACLDTARKRALERSEQPWAGPWNENYFQLALIDLWELDHDRRWLNLALGRMEQTWRARSDQVGREDSLWKRKLPTWYFPQDDSFAMTLMSGVMLDPIARFLRVIHETPEMGDFRDRTRAWLPAARQVVETHDPEWVELPDGSGTYLEPYPKGPRRVYPSGGSRITPFNRALWLAMPMLHLGRVLNDTEYVRRVTRMAQHFKSHCETLENGSLAWEYLPSTYPADGEDISHAHCQLLFSELCCTEGIVFTEGDLRKMALTLEKNVFRYDDVPCETVRGANPGLHLAVGAWGSLCRFDPRLFPKIVAVVETLMAEGKFNFSTEGWGVRILTLMEKARRLFSDHE
ncbi:MAG: hypothetical protein HYU36_03570 [Planctomycetes bacterium]|nr:hypothetical protein [Planctomycetota bacterium]